LGSRLRPLTNTIPKCLVPIGDKPLLSYWIETLISSGITEILINTHYLPEQINLFVESSEYKKYLTLVFEPDLLNTGGTLLANQDFFENDSIMLIHADNFSICDYSKFISAHHHRPKETMGTMMTFNTDNPQSCGIVELDSQGIICNFYEKIENPPSNLANGAVYIFEPEIFAYLEKEKENEGIGVIDFSNDILPKLMGKIYSFHNNQCHIDIGTIKNYQLACDYTENN